MVSQRWFLEDYTLVIALLISRLSAQVYLSFILLPLIYFIHQIIIRSLVVRHVYIYNCLLICIFFRYLILLYTAIVSLRNKPSFSKDKNWVHRQESDICMLQLFDSFMGAAPQLILQLYVISILQQHASCWTSKQLHLPILTLNFNIIFNL